MLYLYAIFHVNLAFSSIEEEQRPEVIRRCYWPLLRLAAELDLPLGIEASGHTLEVAASLDSAWVAELRRLSSTTCEFIGSGYVQLIGPLVPGRVNRENLKLGNRVYENLLAIRPRVALVNEQAYSAGLLRHYKEAGYESIVMEWDNPAHNHPSWNSEWRYLPQLASGQNGEQLPVLWNNSIFFQKFQRYVHGEMELEPYLDFLTRHDDGTIRAIPLYGNDVEIFNFRPGRFMTETAIADDEWSRIRRLFETLLADGRFKFLSPSSLLPLMHENEGGNRLSLESPEAPIPVKKQEKYNITRWAVTGRDDLAINTACWRVYDALSQAACSTDDDWKELCYLWSSDFRTHITARRWQRYLKRLAKYSRIKGADTILLPLQEEGFPELPRNLSVIREGHHLLVETATVKVRLNVRRGLAIDSVIFPDICAESLCGTLPHGFYDDITTGADFYTGHLVFESQGRPKITDLEPVEPIVSWHPETDTVTVSGVLASALGKVVKQISIAVSKGEISIDYSLHWPIIPVGTLRIGNITLMPDAFEEKELFFRTHNGGWDMDTFHVAGRKIAHGDATSFLVSAKQGLGVTEGVLEIGDRQKILRVESDKSLAALLGLITFKPVRDSYFFRCAFSASEMDETSRQKLRKAPVRFKLTISARLNG
ncbi:MAG: glycoside hydrolase family 57 [Geobacter sp.]|nr:glycoside hydrolase family 57 [Geobacter sp.]